MPAPLNHRQREIVATLRKAGGLLRTPVIARALAVSEQTVRRNIKPLAERGAVEVLHGGVRLLDREPEGDFHQRLDRHPEAKQKIAAQVARMIDSDTSLFLDIGSTTAFIADALRDHQRLLVVTNSVHVAYRLSMRNGNRVFMPGGELRQHDGGVFGADALAFVEHFRTDYAILSAAGINASDGISLFDLEEARFSHRIMNLASTCIVATDASKFDRSAPVAVGDPSLVDHLVCEHEPPTSLREAAVVWDTSIHIAD